jgi:crossover junction endodeoxyribonuclease RusA
MTSSLTFTVPGSPAPQGSKTFKGIRGGRGILVESSAAVGPWRERIAIVAHNAMAGRPIFVRTPVAVDLVFTMPRPKSTPRNTPPAIKRPDLDKLARAVLDSLTQIVFLDDALVVNLNCHKRIALIEETPGVRVTIREARP